MILTAAKTGLNQIKLQPCYNTNIELQTR